MALSQQSKAFLHAIGGAALVIGGFILVFFGYSRASKIGGGEATDIAHADAPYAQSYYQADYGCDACGSCGDSGCGDSGCGDSGCGGC